MSAQRLADVGEFGFLSHLLPQLSASDPCVRIGVGDDAAVVDVDAPLVLTTDALVAGTHFQPGWLSPYQIGRRAYLVNASDIAAMGARPRWCLVSLGAPHDTAERDLLRLMLGVRDAAAEHDATVIGGNVTLSPVLFVSLTLLGTAAAQPIARSGGNVGDRLYVSGELGGAATAVRALLAGTPIGARSRARRAYAEPPARVQLGARLAASGVVSAMIDISDGLLQDLEHICDLSRVGARLDIDNVPVFAPGSRRPSAAAIEQALRGGEDYELLFTVPPAKASRVEQIGSEVGCRLTQIGILTQEHGIVAADGRRLGAAGAAGGYDHYRRGRSRRRAPGRELGKDGRHGS